MIIFNFKWKGSSCHEGYTICKYLTLCNLMRGKSMYSFIPNGVCSSKIEFEVIGNIIQSVKFTDGCNGNAQGISALLVGMSTDEAIKRLKGITCDEKPTSCPDQLALALSSITSK